MALKINTQAPDFTLASTSGEDFTLSVQAAGKPIIIYFYPKDFTRVCSQEACDFRDNITFFKDLDIDVVGISRDSISTHERFREHYQLPFHLLADTTGKVARSYDALIPLIGIPKRVTYLLNSQHQVIAVYENLFSAQGHIKEMIAKVKTI